MLFQGSQMERKLYDHYPLVFAFMQLIIYWLCDVFFHEFLQPKTPATPKVQNATTKTLFVGNLSFKIERADVYVFFPKCIIKIFCICYLISKLFRENFFKDCGEVVDVRFSSDENGKFKGFGHVEFATAEAAQNVSLCTG